MSKTCTEARELVVSGRRIPYLLTRKAVKNINLRVRPDGSIAVSAAPGVPLSAIEDFIRREAAFIRAAQERQQKRREELPAPIPVAEGALLPVYGTARRLHFEKSSRFGYRLEAESLTLLVGEPESPDIRRAALRRFLAEEAERALTARTAALLPLFLPCPDKMPLLKFREMTAKWGICRPKSGTITLNKALVLVPPPLADYVICHELAHFKHPDHSPAFWAHLATVLPDCRARKKALHTFGMPPIDL
ncbi:MAG: M48 family metallopeptidase [Ruminococcaceae bacterium]|nr:M48 family metallopeptidase [Oscillospiraceae bacterium]